MFNYIYWKQCNDVLPQIKFISFIVPFLDMIANVWFEVCLGLLASGKGFKSFNFSRYRLKWRIHQFYYTFSRYNHRCLNWFEVYFRLLPSSEGFKSFNFSRYRLKWRKFKFQLGSSFPISSFWGLGIIS